MYIVNLSLTSTLEKMTPYEGWYEKSPNVNHFKVFGCLAYLHVPHQNRKKLDVKSDLCIFIWYSATSKSYKLYNSLNNKLIVSRDIIFDEGGVYGHKKGHVEKTKSILNNDIIVDNNHDQPTNVYVTSGLTPLSSPSSISSTLSSSPTFSPSSTRKVIKLSDIYESSANQAHEESPIGEIVNFALLAKAELCFEDACTNEVWMQAMQEEMDSIQRNDNWTLRELPHDKKKIGTKWVYKSKFKMGVLKDTKQD